MKHWLLLLTLVVVLGIVSSCCPPPPETDTVIAEATTGTELEYYKFEIEGMTCFWVRETQYPTDNYNSKGVTCNWSEWDGR